MSKEKDMTTCVSKKAQQLEFIKAFIRRNYIHLSQDLEVGVVVPYLHEKGVLTTNQKEQFLQSHICDLLNKITRTDPPLFIHFMKCMKEHYPPVLQSLVLPFWDVFLTSKKKMLTSSQKTTIQQIILYNPTSNPTDMLENIFHYTSQKLRKICGDVLFCQMHDLCLSSAFTSLIDVCG